MNYVAYTTNTDGSINILAGSTNPTVFTKILPADTQYEVHEGEIYSTNGKTWLSNTDEGYIEAKVKEEKQNDFIKLDAQYNEEKDQLIKIYTDAIIHNDTELQQSIQEEMSELDTWYDEEYVHIKGE